METSRQTSESDRDADKGDVATLVTAHETCENRVVFTETDNTDGWIATDSAVDLWQ